MTEIEPLHDDDPFAEIRPYSNREAPDILRRLTLDAELIETLAQWRLSRLNRIWPAFAQTLARLWLQTMVRRLSSVEDLQNLIAPALSRMIKKTSQFSVSGIEHLDLTQARVYLSNHRDIFLDAAYANYALHRMGARTMSLAIGDNLLSKQWVADLMRLNKSFVVKRNLGGPRALLAATKLLARFIRQSVTQDHHPIWIAQREGRAKDGRDVTEPAVIKMLTLSRRQNETPEAVLKSLNIVPLVIAYELDPCDVLKAAELSAGATYTKAEFEDVTSMSLGIMGQKGCVHLHFGDPLDPDLDVAGVVSAIDQQMVAYYRLYGTNVWAWEWLHDRKVPDFVTPHQGEISEAAFRSRIEAAPLEYRERLLAMYANPVSRLLSETVATEGA
ncbi:1-acyl-sn-glycerol-3-phosphate acyltransferase [Luminiphilus sp.]|nr:1-acyl-sn-glycerol-3-phosphate acyltransferase [Luminiphilus sp.]